MKEGKFCSVFVFLKGIAYIPKSTFAASIAEKQLFKKTVGRHYQNLVFQYTVNPVIVASISVSLKREVFFH